ncbi:unnamed protein product [Kuraishia capsulata CBS 1993]|uniref:Trehalase n=1 Tax=Kuraishia capsulata CBS 1993 TaxID=1382522 RepID=W6MSV3_9ASCO|nr:uncharacterized protein KUCA_T00005797001 [Kuraishia capsulata CBS 1993]CDK29804.1 unnamed protein product [Kuraishia capsulata CBS 1993]
MSDKLPTYKDYYHRRTSSASDDVDPFSTPDLYYGPQTDPSTAKKTSSLGRTRTMSVVVPKKQGGFQGHTFSPIMSASNSPTPSPAQSSRASPVPGAPFPTRGQRANFSLAEDDDIKALATSRPSSPLPPGFLDGLSQLPQGGPVYHNQEVNNSQFQLPTGSSASTSSGLRRRASADGALGGVSKRFFISDIDSTLAELLESEDTNQDYQITIEDRGPKVLKLGTANSNGFKMYDVRGTYMLSNLLQELTIAKRMGRKQMILDEARLNENPVNRLKRMITTQFWKSLTRQLSPSHLVEMARDPKIHTTPESRLPRIYVPHGETEKFEFFTAFARDHPEVELQVEYLPEKITPEYVQSINGKPGLLTLAMRSKPLAKETGSDFEADSAKHVLEGFPYVVPGGRFNEQYGWDSYMESLGLLCDDRIDLAIGMVENFIYEIRFYGKILNANRSYYLCRSQPPFLTDMAIKCYAYLKSHKWDDDGYYKEPLEFLKRAFQAAVKEYRTVWCSEPRLDSKTGLSTYHPDGLGIPPETESTHFESLLRPYAEKFGVSIEEFQRLYNSREVAVPELDQYFVHDRAVRESGHDTSYRLEGICADLATVDLNSLLYKYEIDIGTVIRDVFDDKFEDWEGDVGSSAEWFSRAKARKETMDKLMWNEKEGMYFDYNIRTGQPSCYESVTTFWPMWAGLCTKEQAAMLVTKALPRFEELGGLAAGTLRSRGEISLSRPSRQWDYPFGWAPQQILAWVGLNRYGYTSVTRRICYRWLYLMTKAFVDYNGIVVEKYDVTRGSDPHRVEAEYGNQGSDFKGVATEGFGWVNASFVYGLQFLDRLGIRALGMCTPPHVFFERMSAVERANYALE